MKKTLPIIIVIVVLVAVGSFYAGMKYQSGKVPGRAQFAAGEFNNLSTADRQRFQELGAKRMGAGQTNLAFINGEVASKDEQSLTVKMRDGGSKIIFYSANTSIGKMASGTPEDLSVGTAVMVTGKTSSDGSLTAETIQIRDGQAPIGPGAMMPSQQ